MITDRHFSEGTEIQLQMQNCAAKRTDFHYRDRSDSDSPLNSDLFPLQIQTSDSKQINSVIIAATTVLRSKSILVTLNGYPMARGVCATMEVMSFQD